MSDLASWLHRSAKEKLLCSGCHSLPSIRHVHYIHLETINPECAIVHFKYINRNHDIKYEGGNEFVSSVLGVT